MLVLVCTFYPFFAGCVNIAIVEWMRILKGRNVDLQVLIAVPSLI